MNALRQLGIGLGLLGVLTAPVSATPQGFLDNPAPASIQSGIGVISGWVCEADEVTIQIDDGPPLQAAYGTTRVDTALVCGDTENGFGLTFNWNLLGPGPHTLRARVDGVELSRVAFEVTMLGVGEFQRDLVAQSSILDFPVEGHESYVQWEESLQNFVLQSSVEPPTGGSGSLQPRMALENPQPGSFHSGISVISGWACEVENIMLRIDEGDILRVAHGTTRADTVPVCGDEENGFGLTFNWNLLSDGLHTLTAYADGSVFAKVHFAVTSLGLGEFPVGLESLTAAVGTISDFPAQGSQVLVRWQDSLQNFVLDSVVTPGVDSNLCGTQAATLTTDGENAQTATAEITNSCGQETDTTLGFDGSFPIQVLPQAQLAQSQNGQAHRLSRSSVQQLSQATAPFVLCADEIHFQQGQAIFTSEDFDMLDGRGQPIFCRNLQPGGTLQALISVQEGIPLNFRNDFEMFYLNKPIASFLSTRPAGPVLGIPSSTISFGQVEVHDTGEAELKIQNKGAGRLVGQAFVAAPFQLATGKTFHSLVSRQAFDLAAGQEQTLIVRLRPLTKGTFSSQLKIFSNGGTAHIHLNGITP